MKLDKLIHENIEFLQGYLPKLIRAIDELTESFSNNLEKNAIKILPEIIEGLAWAVNSMASLERVGTVKDIDINSLNSFLNEIQQAMENDDYILVSDLFEYEIKPILTIWTQKIEIEKV